VADEGTVIQRVREHLGNLGVPFTDRVDGTLQVEAGSTAVFISVQRSLNYVVVQLVAPVLKGVEARPDRIVQLLQLNADLTFGKFSWDPVEAMVSVDYELVGDVIDAVELEAALHSVRRIADTCDDKLQPLLGGHLPLDAG